MSIYQVSSTVTSIFHALFINPHNQLFEAGRIKKLRHKEVKHSPKLTNVGAGSLNPVLYCLPGC